jgi:uncharacterized protein YjiK
MGIKKLEGAIDALPHGRPWTVDDLGKRAKELGENLGVEERVRLGELLDETWKKWSAPGRRALEVLAGRAAPDLLATRFKEPLVTETGIDEQSAITFVSKEHGFLVIADDSSCVYRLQNGKVEPLREDDGKMNGLEGCTLDQETKSLLVVSENTRRVFEMHATFDGNDMSLSAPKELGRLEQLGERKNKGWEGLAAWSSKLTGDGRSRLLAVNEAEPRAIGVFDRQTLKLEAAIELPIEMTPHPLDLSDLAVDPKTGRIFLLSDDSAAVYEIELRRSDKLVGAGPPLPRYSIVLVGSFELPKKMQAEGICFDQAGDLYVTGELGSKMLTFQRDLGR